MPNRCRGAGGSLRDRNERLRFLDFGLEKVRAENAGYIHLVSCSRYDSNQYKLWKMVKMRKEEALGEGNVKSCGAFL
jgi:hypothetical protein